MKPTILTCLLVTFGASLVAEDPVQRPGGVAKTDWPGWRGPNSDGIADPDQNPPLNWNNDAGIIWKTPVPGRGHGSVCVVGNQVFLAAADHEKNEQLLICLNRSNGKVEWQTKVHVDGIPQSTSRKDVGNEKASFASCTPACDGELVFINFFASRQVFTTALDRSGKIVWQTKISDYTVHQGYGSSPLLFGDLVIVSADNKGGGAVAGLNRRTGKIVWKNKRPAKPNYPSPVVFNLDGKDQLLLTGCDLVTSLNPTDGSTRWEIKGATTECVTTTVTDGTHIFTSGGYPKNHISAVKADGSGTVVWENSVRTYVPSMLARDGLLFAVQDAGVASCWEAATGKELWKGRLGGTISSSPVLVGDRIYVTSEEGLTTIFEASASDFVKLGSNKLGDSVFATPVICGSRIYTRVAHKEGPRRQEYLYCLGDE